MRRKRRALLHVLAAAAAACIGWAVTPRDQEPAADYRELLSRFDPVYPGRGRADYGDHPVADVAKSYAMVLKAELNRMAHAGGNLGPTGEAAAAWLLAHHGSEARGLGWGLPFAWDAFGDRTVNPADTVYTISTAIAVDALIDWIETDPHAPLEQVLRVLKQVLEPFARGAYDSAGGLLAYSTSRHDAKFDCYNPAAYLAGQMQRLAQVHPDRAFAALLRRRADANFAILLEHKRVSPSGAWYWSYSATENVPNDLPHAVYIMHGARAYARAGGRLRDQLDLARIAAHVRDFRDDTLHAWPVFRRDLKPNPPPRLYDLANLVAFLAGGPPQPGFDPAALAGEFSAYRHRDGGYARRPGEALVINEYEAFVLHALSLVRHGGRFLHGSGYDWKAHRLRRAPAGGQLPLSDFGTESHDIAWLPDGAAGGRLAIGGGTLVLPGLVPLKVEEIDPARLLLFARGTASGRTLMIPLEKRGNRWNRGDLIALPAGLRDAVYRGSTRWNGATVAVFHTRRDNANSVVVLPDAAATGRGTRVIPFKVGDPLGYEHQPRVLFQPAGSALYLASGPTLCRLAQELGCWTLAPWARVLELAADGESAVALVEQRDPPVFRASERPAAAAGSGHQFLYDVAMRTVLRRYGAGESVFGLRLDGTRIRLTRADLSRETLWRTFFLDWSLLGNSGMLSYGIDNLDGNVAWSQSYYLSGMLDGVLLDRARRPETGLLRRRLEREALGVLALLKSSKGLQCAAFSADGTPVLHAVQTGKVLLFLKRYAEAGGAREDRDFLRRYSTQVATLAGHVEAFSDASAGEKYRHLRWPRGANFPYDGTALPFNHQNLWAAAVLRGHAAYPVPAHSVAAAADIVRILLEEEGLQGQALRAREAGTDRRRAYQWRYWWGVARAGWNREQQVSVHTPAFAGDRDSVALARYRTFDATAALVAMREGVLQRDPELTAYFARGVQEGELELFLLPFLDELGARPAVPDRVLLRELRFDSQPDLRNSLTALVLLDARR